jgi:hypothetical protein
MQAHGSHVDLEAGRWRIPESKSTAGKRTLQLLPEILSVFAARASGCRPAGWLFAGKSLSMPMKSVERARQKALTRAGLSLVLYDHVRHPLGRARHGSRDHRAATRTREPAVMR